MTIPPKVTKEMVEALDAFFSDDAVTYYSEADAFAITALARRVIEPDEETVERCARIMLHLQFGPLVGTRMEREKTLQWRNRVRDARAVLAALVEG